MSSKTQQSKESRVNIGEQHFEDIERVKGMRH
jgi:hypothetical protein